MDEARQASEEYDQRHATRRQLEAIEEDCLPERPKPKRKLKRDGIAAELRELRAQSLVRDAVMAELIAENAELRRKLLTVRLWVGEAP